MRGARLDPDEFIDGFVAEATELIRAGNAGLLAIEAAMRAGGPAPGRAVRDVFRAVHTVKGLAAMTGVEPIVALAHRMEATLRASDQHGAALTLDGVDAMLRGLAAIEERLAAVAARRPAPPAPAELLDALEGGVDAAPPREEGPEPGALALEPALASKLAGFEMAQLLAAPAQGRRVVRVDFVPSPARAAQGLTITSVRERVGRVAELVKVLPLSLPQGPEAPGGLAFVLIGLTTASDAEIGAAAGVDAGVVRTLLEPRAAAAPAAAPAAPPAGEGPGAPSAEPSAEPEPAPARAGRDVVRVDVARLDEAIDRLGALAVTRLKLSRAIAALAAKGADVRELDLVAAEGARHLRDLRAAILRVRMVPAAEVLERLPLVVRGLRRATGRSVRLELEPGAAELDKAVAERIFPALVHLVRNAVDHAIEPPEERRRLGKPEEGLLRIRCVARTNAQAEVTVQDDGRGVDAAALAARAGRPVPRTAAALLDMICTPGLSSRDEATTTSGRGMGMDIVRRIVVEELGGELELSTEAGRGTTFALRVPLTLAIVDAFSLECAGQSFVVPVSMVDEIIEVDRARIVGGPGAETEAAAEPGEGAARVGLLERRGEALPLVGLAAALRLAGAPSGEGKALVVRRGGEPVAFGVDRIAGRHEIVVRPLEDRLARAPGISGAADLGDGRPTLVLDLVALGSRLSAFAREGAA